MMLKMRDARQAIALPHREPNIATIGEFSCKALNVNQLVHYGLNSVPIKQLRPYLYKST